MFKKLLAIALIASSFNMVSAANEEIECSSDAVFSEYSCNQCFDGWVKNQWAYFDY